MGTRGSQGCTTGLGDSPQPCATSLPSLGETEAQRVQSLESVHRLRMSPCPRPAPPSGLASAGGTSPSSLPQPPPRRASAAAPDRFSSVSPGPGSVTRCFLLWPGTICPLCSGDGPTAMAGRAAATGQQRGLNPAQCPAPCRGGAAQRGPGCSLSDYTTARSRQGQILHGPQPFPGEGRGGTTTRFPDLGLIKALLH